MRPERTTPARLPAHGRAGAEAFLVSGAENLAVETPAIGEAEVAFLFAYLLPAQGAGWVLVSHDAHSIPKVSLSGFCGIPFQTACLIKSNTTRANPLATSGLERICIICF